MSFPDRLCTGFLAVVVVLTLALITQQFRWWLVLPGIVVAVVASRRLILPVPLVSRGQLLGVTLAVLIAVAWTAINMPLAGQAMGVVRDPGQYTLAGLYLIDHPSKNIAVTPDALRTALEVPGVVTDWSGRPSTSLVRVQGPGLVPALIGLLGWFFGPAGALYALVAVAGLALIGLYALARRMVGPLWGLLPVVAVATAIPLAAFGRIPYTEPSCLLLASAAMAALYCAARRRDARLALLAGLFAGATVITRIDGWLVVAGGVVALALTGIFASGDGHRQRRAEVRRMLLMFVWGSLITALLGVAETWINSPNYFGDVTKQTLPLIGGTAVLVGLGLWLLRPGVTGPFAGYAARHRTGFAATIAVLTGVILVLLASRPLWLVSRLTDPKTLSAVRNRQAYEGLPVDPERSYDEYTVTSHAWYFGWALVALGGIGIVWLVYRCLRRRDPAPLAALGPAVVSAAVYLNWAAVTPDQVWAFRRMLPVIAPGLLVAAAFAARQLAVTVPAWLRAYRARRARPGRTVSTGGTTARAAWAGLVAAAALLVSLYPAFTWGPLFTAREGAGQQPFVERVCQVIDGRRTLVVGSNPSFGFFLPTAQEACGVSALGVPRPTRTTLAAVAESWGDPGSIVVVGFHAGEIPWAPGTMPSEPDDSESHQMWAQWLTKVPQSTIDQRTDIWMGTLQPDGTVLPLRS
ncbi:hypothetical protein [Nakamurella aerolata]|uniref:Glycosyltransferase RgtA/B/C/D-like domain-containing protein n=1 Tax=Nakamurella aerolata TaxID=1656892 RepID=A0A849AJQ6_9ACTN|nr:hypothetical protein [Nakamurella aerolata]NNG37052.1 hypothetical protein [Nakamurella aerolata]